MKYQGVLTKMTTENTNQVQYYLNTENHVLHLNQIIDKSVAITFVGYQCLCCGKEKKIFRQGHCYECFYEQPGVADWVMKPELSKAHLGIEDRDLAYEEKAQLQPHIVYLALSSNVKVGVTRKSQIPTRWIDQGANKAIVFVETPNRFLAGITEVALKEFVSDKTSWQKMLKNDVVEEDLIAIKEQLKAYLPEEVQQYYVHEDLVLEFNYPVENYPIKVGSLNLEKENFYQGKLIGVKGQYLIFEDGKVFNVRSYEGYKVSIEIA
ncbi:DUF2797 domain-containing protein [Wenyingzhuangia sp. 2_MG-2023]|uniref:DUF2797 domain-containing protein n=1 Tax=Wenyingzhuangia sp. 2_MG-2023 TaxID=3062639 RepID=UPI0026E15323|nr:DUF2797 domain-containing protein [Wenyingzhuangia sp. 2_MG-2023]MDO6737662.1 DUF2797 domain-containing protein [Wenyingzhuangia sp. 2_MG-2023]MDO6802501.1 DUF2797 domain-containing protein [Wenyingzhuangia sp. 1_MG-2023]